MKSVFFHDVKITLIVSKLLNKSAGEHKSSNGLDEMQWFLAEDNSITIKNSPKETKILANENKKECICSVDFSWKKEKIIKIFYKKIICIEGERVKRC